MERHLPAIDGLRAVAVLAVVALAFVLREWFVLATTIIQPTSGDAATYLRYALRMAEFHTFSSAEGWQAVVPDAYRTPGYPTLLLWVYGITGREYWLAGIQQAQVALGTATVALTIAIARRFLRPAWALLAGFLLAVQPHHIAATGTILSEVLFGFLLALSLWLTLRAMEGRSVGPAGAAFGAAYLTNPIIALFPVGLGLVLPPRRALALLLVSLLAVGGWALRNHVSHAGGDTRAAMNIVQGSFPTYHYDAHRWPLKPQSKANMDTMQREWEAIGRSPREGLGMVWDRVSAEPGRMLRWYALEKPFLLWDWDIRMGAGGPYQNYVRHSPLDGPLQPVMVLAWALNPALFAFSLAFALWAVVRGLPAERLVALAFGYLTAIHVVFQAEPRYATAYRSVEILLACGALAYVVGKVRALAPHAEAAGDRVPVFARLTAQRRRVALDGDGQG